MYITILLIIDQVAKWLSKVNLQPSSVFRVINNILSFVYVENRGAAFGMMNGWQLFLITITIIVIVVLAYKYVKDIRKKEASIPLKISFNLLIAGSIGNLIDRISLGYVIDFIKLEFVNFAVFNLADVYICMGCAFLIYYVIFDYKEEEE